MERDTARNMVREDIIESMVESTAKSMVKDMEREDTTEGMERSMKINSSEEEIISWKKLSLLLFIYFTILIILQIVTNSKPITTTIIYTFDLYNKGYSTNPPEIEIFTLIEKLGSEGRFLHLIGTFIDAFLFVPIYTIVHYLLWRKFITKKELQIFLPLLYFLIILTSLFDTIENFIIILLLLTFPYLTAIFSAVNISTTISLKSIVDLIIESDFNFAINGIKYIARMLHYVTPLKFYFLNGFFICFIGLAIVNYILEESSSEVNNNNKGMIDNDQQEQGEQERRDDNNKIKTD
ncbi:hypothetical protein ABK040_012637 [Willaertia magna]